MRVAWFLWKQPKTYIFVDLVWVWEHEAMYAGHSGHQDHHVAVRLVDTDSSEDRGALKAHP